VDLLGTLAGLALYPAKLFRNGPSGYETIQLAALKVPHPEDRVHHFVDSVLAGKKPMVTLEESLKLQQILDAIYTSAATGKEPASAVRGTKPSAATGKKPSSAKR